MSPALTRDAPIEERVPEIVRILSETYPDAKVALNFSNALEMLVATILSAQCTDEKVNEVTATLFQKYRTAEDYLRVPEDELKADIKPTGLLQPEGDLDPGGVPPDRRGLRGRGAEHDGGPHHAPRRRPEDREHRARNSFGIVEGVAVDTHVKRLANRLGFSEQADTDKIEQDLMRLIPRERWFDFTYVLIDHGRAICIARKPKCDECPVNHLCPSSLV